MWIANSGVAPSPAVRLPAAEHLAAERAVLTTAAF